MMSFFGKVVVIALFGYCQSQILSGSLNICGANEELRICGPQNSQTCFTEPRALSRLCAIERCIPGCFCRPGYVRLIANGPCVRMEACPFYPKCPANSRVIHPCQTSTCLYINTFPTNMPVTNFFNTIASASASAGITSASITLQSRSKENNINSRQSAGIGGSISEDGSISGGIGGSISGDGSISGGGSISGDGSISAGAGMAGGFVNGQILGNIRIPNCIPVCSPQCLCNPGYRMFGNRCIRDSIITYPIFEGGNVNFAANASIGSMDEDKRTHQSKQKHHHNKHH